MANALALETSPYLKQHAHNPVHWRPWSPAAWEQARTENKLVLVSIGYAACHWCHVMEHESFEDEGIAAIMNRDFICLKVDREERPDIDQVYIEAVQLLSGHAGWPLNCFCLPDGRPVYGGTYFKPAQWTQLLQRLTALWGQDAASLEQQAAQLTAALRRPEAQGNAPVTLDAEAAREALRKGVDRAKLSFDRSEGGTQRAPKFPLPVNWRFLLRYGEAQNDEAVLRQVRLTLAKMADGGICDQLGGGFARYSVDAIWKVPHFEKMLYDNAQLLSLYAQAYAVFRETRWRDVALSIATFLKRDLNAGDGLFFASLDADSEGVEGLFYVWSEEELQAMLEEDFPWFAALHGVDERGYWEEEHFILLGTGDPKERAEIASKFDLTLEELNRRDAQRCEQLLQKRALRIAPGLDDKVLVSWNALAIGALAEAGLWLQAPDLIHLAEKGAQQLLQKAFDPQTGLQRSRQNGQFAIAGFLEDYAHFAWALLQLHRATQDSTWIFAAEGLVNFAEAHFSDADTGLFYFTSDRDAPLVARKMEIQDNVLPSANGVLARCLLRLGELLGKEVWVQRGERMLAHGLPEFSTYLLAHAGWADATLDRVAPHYLVSVLGPKALDNARTLAVSHLPQATVVADKPETKPLPCLQGQDAGGRDVFVICRDQTCEAPVTSAEEARALMPAKF